MKAALTIAAVLCFSASAALADCPAHKKVTASVDTEITTASITTTDDTEMPSTDDAIVLKKQGRIANETSD
ncbi:hypothetical protein [Sinorhizobium sp. BG8]|uniref:hypothetical protein n=1 Tax=Sinorhizobium sp. BG8 TaxID=2613773 RepID=UPI00193DCBD8|nr:hypothetical protein [Sinorhizobium sp. BG8]QRM53861.1 hypothetical protein F3Y30_04285 [Sinorhizobium sp. BG8]